MIVTVAFMISTAAFLTQIAGIINQTAFNKATFEYLQIPLINQLFTRCFFDVHQ